MRINTAARILAVGEEKVKKDFRILKVKIETPPRKNEFEEVVRDPEVFECDYLEKVADESRVDHLHKYKADKTLLTCALDLRSYTYKDKKDQSEKLGMSLNLKKFAI